MESKIPIFMSITFMFLPLLFFAKDTGVFIVISFFIILFLSIENILFTLKFSKNKKLAKEMALLKVDLEKKSKLDLTRLSLGFKTAKTIFITTFVVTILIVLDINIFLSVMSIAVLLLSVIELRHYNSKKISHISFCSGITNFIYLSVVAVSKYIL